MNYLQKILLIVVVCYASLANAQTNSQTSAEELNRHYAEILEKTNEQLSLWWNPYGVFIAALGLLVAVGGIWSVVVIYRQGAEHKKLLQDSVKEFSEKYDELWNKQAAEKNSSLKIFKIK